MGIVTHFIDTYLEMGIADQVIITGLDGSGKTFMLKELIGKYRYIKYASYDEEPINFDFIASYQLFDRHPIIDRYVYTNFDDQSDKYNELNLNLMERYLKKHYPKGFIVLFLHDIFIEKKPNEPDWVTNHRNLIYERFILVLKRLQKMKYPTMVTTETSFFLLGGIYV